MISERLSKTRQDNKVFIPLNMEGEATKTSKFWRMEKSALLFVVGISFLIVNAFVGEMNILIRIIANALWGIISWIAIAKIVLEEKKKKEIYSIIDVYRMATTGIFWGIAYIKETFNGIYAFFIDGKVGVFLRPQRGSIIGQDENFAERHYDAVSDFYLEAQNKGYSTIYSNTMEKAIKDPRLKYLEKEIKNEPNKGMRALMEKNLQAIKMKAENTLYETDTMLVYSKNLAKTDIITKEASDIGSKLLGGAYLKISEMNEKEIMDFHKEINSVEYFDAINAKADLFHYDNNNDKDIVLTKITMENGGVINLLDEENKIINNCYNRKINGEENIDIYEELKKNKYSNVVEIGEEDKKEDKQEGLQLEIEEKEEEKSEKNVMISEDEDIDLETIDI